MRSERAKTIQPTLLVATLFGVSTLTGCAGGTGTAGETPVTSIMAVGAGSAAVDQLDFFDALEKRSNVTWDELLAGVLLAAGRRADGEYADRFVVAKRAGILGGTAPPGPSALAAPGDLAKLMLRAQGIQLRETLSDDEALVLASRRSLVPSTLTAKDPLTGAVAVGALSAAGRPVGAVKRAGTASASPATNQSTKPPFGGSKP